MPTFSFSGHETFPLRFLWLPKAVRAAAEDPAVFRSGEAIATFGVGRNMVRAMRHWGLATGALREGESRGAIVPTAWGLATFGEGGTDPYCEHLATGWRLHWRLCREADRATLWHFLFGHFRGHTADLDGLAHSLGEWLEAQGAADAQPKRSTLRRDLTCLAGTYAPVTRQDAEDAALSPLAGLGLVERSAGALVLRRGRRTGLTPEVFADAVLDFWARTAPTARTLAISDVLSAPASPGRVFGLGEDQAFELIEAIEAEPEAAFRFDSTAGVQQLYRDAPVPPAERDRQLGLALPA